MAVTRLQDLNLLIVSDAGTARLRETRPGVGQGEDGSNEEVLRRYVWNDADKKDNFTAYKLLIADVIDENLVDVPRAVMAAGGIMQGAHGGIDIPAGEVDRVKSHLAKYYRKMDDTLRWND